MGPIVKNSVLNEQSKEYCIMYYTLRNNQDMLANIEST